MTRSISPAHGFANGAIGISRRRAADRDAMLQETMSAASYLFGYLLRSLGELSDASPSDEKGSELVLLRTLDAISLILGARILVAEITETSAGRQRLIALLLLLISLSTCSREAAGPLLVAIRTADRTIAIELELAAAESGRVMALIGKETSPIRAVVTALRASIGFSSAFGGRTAAITVNAR
ncbi:hypothetical protein [Rhizobium sp. BE258]|uniref:hypothetical protein n=1 Tax=Rhizobium sp. BE258 TaxID=2817722 RepID=UPI002858547A|nr:hypothetical protein [Rhizobium sp. BE258]MDR7145322.1 putative RNA-binding protein YlqC (UPF0109 family) [Rhizobium sp. BE258]